MRAGPALCSSPIMATKTKSSPSQSIDEVRQALQEPILFNSLGELRNNGSNSLASGSFTIFSATNSCRNACIFGTELQGSQRDQRASAAVGRCLAERFSNIWQWLTGAEQKKFPSKASERAQGGPLKVSLTHRDSLPS